MGLEITGNKIIVTNPSTTTVVDNAIFTGTSVSIDTITTSTSLETYLTIDGPTG